MQLKTTTRDYQGTKLYSEEIQIHVKQKNW